MSAIFYWTGLIVWAAFAFTVFWLVIVEGARALANSISCTRWRIRNSPKFKLRKHWHSAVWVTLRDALLEFYGYRNVGNRTHTHTNGHVWRGIGDWTVPGKQGRRTRG